MGPRPGDITLTAGVLLHLGAPRRSLGLPGTPSLLLPVLVITCLPVLLEASTCPAGPLPACCFLCVDMSPVLTSGFLSLTCFLSLRCQAPVNSLVPRRLSGTGVKPIFRGPLLARGAARGVLSPAEMQGCTRVLLDPRAVLSLPAVPLSRCPAARGPGPRPQCSRGAAAAGPQATLPK